MIDGLVAQIIPPVLDDRGNEVPIESRFAPEVVAQLVEYPPKPEAPVLTMEQMVELALTEIRTKRQPIIQVLDGLQSSANSLQDYPRALSIEVAKQGLRDLTKLNLFGCTTYEEMQQTVLAAYLSIASALPADIRVAFAEATK